MLLNFYLVPQYERQTEKEKTIEMTEKLDEEWKDLRQLMSMGGAVNMNLIFARFIPNPMSIVTY